MNEMGIDAIRQEIRPKIKKEEMKYVEIEIMLQKSLSFSRYIGISTIQ